MRTFKAAFLMAAIAVGAKAEELFVAIQRLEHCFWIPAGAYLASPEFAAMPGKVTLVGGEYE